MRLDAEQLSDLNVRIAQKVFNANMDGSLFMLLRRMGMDYLLDEVNGVDTGNPMGDSRRLVPELWRTTPTCTRSFDCGAAPLSLRLPPDLVLDFGGVIGLAHVGKAAHGGPHRLHGGGRPKRLRVARLPQNPRHEALQGAGRNAHREEAVVTARESLRAVKRVYGSELAASLVQADGHILDPLVVEEAVRRHGIDDCRRRSERLVQHDRPT